MYDEDAAVPQIGGAGGQEAMPMPNTRLQRKLTKQSPAKERRQARAIFANAHGNAKALDLAKALQRSATAKLKRR